MKHSMHTTMAALLAACFFVAGTARTEAAALQLSPISVDVQAPGASSTITLSNHGDGLINAQIRVFRWTQRNGRDELVPTTDVVASPPFAKIQPNGDYTVRIVRVSKKALQSEESYRLIIDELPSKPSKSGISIKLVVRYSIPVFFGVNRQHSGQLAWAIEKRGTKTWVVAKNTSARRVRLSSLRVKSPIGSGYSFGNGLAGYVLGHSSNQWRIMKNLKGLAKNGHVLVTAQGDNGPIKQKAPVRVSK